jgi:transcriptional regulator with XRE-family HTH domain
MTTKTAAKSIRKKVVASPPEDPFFARSKEGVAYRLRLTRKVLGGNQRDFAAKAGIGNSTYNQYETATTYPSWEEAMRLCDTYKLTLDWIFRGNASGLRREIENALEALHQADSRSRD